MSSAPPALDAALALAATVTLPPAVSLPFSPGSLFDVPPPPVSVSGAGLPPGWRASAPAVPPAALFTAPPGLDVNAATAGPPAAARVASADAGAGAGDGTVSGDAATLPFPVYDAGKFDVGTGYVRVSSFRSADCAPQPEPYGVAPQVFALGVWSTSPRHPERGLALVECDGDRGRGIISPAAAATPGGGVVTSCARGAQLGPRTYAGDCFSFRFLAGQCTPVDEDGTTFSYTFECVSLV